MKLLLSLMVAGTALFAGGDLIPVQVETRFEKVQVQVEPAPAPTRGCYKPNIPKCPDCEDVAEICPDDPSLPIAKTEVCQGLINNAHR